MRQTEREELLTSGSIEQQCLHPGRDAVLQRADEIKGGVQHFIM